MKRIIYVNWLIFCFLVNVANVASGNNETNIQNVKREIEFNEKRNTNNGEIRLISADAMNVLENGINAVDSGICSAHLKSLMDGLENRMPWAISSKNFLPFTLYYNYYTSRLFYENDSTCFLFAFDYKNCNGVNVDIICL